MQPDMKREIVPPQQTLQLREPEQREKTGAAAVHVGDIFFPIICPAIAYLFARKKSDYIASHARQAILEALWLKLFLGIAILVSLGFSIAHFWELYQGGFENIDWWPELGKVVLKGLIVWILLAILGFINTILSILQAIKAFQGQWPKAWIKKMAKANR